MKTTVIIELTGPRCQKCNRPTVFKTEVAGTGSSTSTSVIIHHADCPELHCEHGARVWGPDNTTCEIESCTSNQATGDDE